MQEQILYKKLIKSIVDYLKKYMKNLNIKFSEDKDDFGIILEYLNFKEKLIIPFPRTNNNQSINNDENIETGNTFDYLENERPPKRQIISGNESYDPTLSQNEK